MFEQSVVAAGGGFKKPAAVSAAGAAQVAIAGVAMIYPLLRIPPPERIDLRPPSLFSRAVELVEIKTPIAASPLPASAARPRLSFPRFDAPRIASTAAATALDEAPEWASADAGPSIGSAPIPGWIAPRIGGPSQPPRPAPPAAKPAAVKPAEPAPSAPYRAGGRVQPPSVVSAAKPVYPPLAVKSRIQGVVRLEAVIAKDGRITSLRAVSGHPMLVPAALEAVRHWRYEPTLLNGQPVEVALAIDVNFTLANL